jgi:hypothetical protein
MGVLRIASTLAAAAVAFSGYAAYRRRHGQAVRDGLRRKPEPLQRWEGEGGAVPAVQGAGSRNEERADADASH